MKDRDIALRIDAMLKSANFNLVAVSEYIKNNVSNKELRHELILHIGSCLSESNSLSDRLYELYPDITPPELIPPKG